MTHEYCIVCGNTLADAHHIVRVTVTVLVHGAPTSHQTHRFMHERCYQGLNGMWPALYDHPPIKENRQ